MIQQLVTVQNEKKRQIVRLDFVAIASSWRYRSLKSNEWKINVFMIFKFLVGNTNEHAERSLSFVLTNPTSVTA